MKIELNGKKAIERVPMTDILVNNLGTAHLDNFFGQADDE